MPVYPNKTAFSFPNCSGGNHHKLEAHLFEPLYTFQSVWDWEGIVDSVCLVIFQHLALNGGMSQRRANEALIKTLQKSLWVSPNQDSVGGSALVVWVRRFTYAPVIVIWRSGLTGVKQRGQYYLLTEEVGQVNACSVRIVVP